jgi:hypothetical protein
LNGLEANKGLLPGGKGESELEDDEGRVIAGAGGRWHIKKMVEASIKEVFTYYRQPFCCCSVVVADAVCETEVRPVLATQHNELWEDRCQCLMS